MNACGVFLLAVVVQEPARWSAAWRPLAAGLSACAVLAGALLAYPLYIQFAGPMAYHGLSDAVRDYGNDIAAFFAPGSPTLGGNQRANINLAPNYSEENAFFGWSLALLAVGIVGWLRRELLVRALAATGVVFAVLSLGERVSWWDRNLFTGPWEWLVRVPLLDAVVPTRFGLITSVVIGLLLALAVERAWSLRPADLRTVQTLVVAGLVLALLPIAPMPLRVVSRPPVPDFITADRWRTYVGPDQTLVPPPTSTSRSPAATSSPRATATPATRAGSAAGPAAWASCWRRWPRPGVRRSWTTGSAGGRWTSCGTGGRRSWCCRCASRTPNRCGVPSSSWSVPAVASWTSGSGTCGR
jgi:hypothetical protein